MNKLILFYMVLIFCSQTRSEILTLDQALLTAQKENWNLQLVKAKYMQANSVVFKTLSSYLPKFSITGNYTRNSHESKFTMPTLPDERAKKIILQPLNSLGMQAQISQMLISPWYIAQMLNLGKYGESIRLHRDQGKRDILFSVSQLYYAASASKEAINIQERLLLNKIAHEKDINLRFEQGYVIKADVLSAQVDTAKSEQELSFTKNSHQTDKLALANMLNRDSDFDITEPPTPRRLDSADLEQTNIKNRRLDLKAAKYEEELAQSAKVNNFLKYLPDLSLFLQYKNSNSEGLGGKKSSYAAGINLNLNIFDGGLREAEIYESSGKALAAKAQARLHELNLNQEIETAKIALSSADANLALATKQIELSRELLRLVKISYDEGLATYLKLSDASDALAAAEMALVSQNLNVNLAALKLQHAVGIFE